jgi:hypothetical protein
MNRDDAAMNSAVSQVASGNEPPQSLAGAKPLRVLALIWGVGGFVALLLYAIGRLLPLALDSLAYSWSLLQTAVFVGNLVVMAWLEGYRGFQCRYSPRFAARSRQLLLHANLTQTLLAPLVCMGFVYAPSRRMIGAWALTLGIVAIVLLYRILPQPWRGILDAGVVIGLAWGLAATVYHVVRALHKGPLVDSDMR